jgi:uncharacterized SAM-binding protein YcdF (DUF218 family)
MSEHPTAGRRARLPIWLALGLALIAVAYTTRGYWLPALADWLDVGEQPVRTDYVMLLNGDPETRPFEVADLYHRGKADRVLITSADEPESRRVKVHQVARLTLTKCGVPPAKIDFVDSRCRSTFDEAKTLDRFMTAHPAATFTVVTNTYHTRRSRWVLRHVLGDKMSRVSLVSAQTDAFHSQNWWRNEDGFVLYLAELLKSVFYFVRYGNGLVWISVMVGLIGIGWCLRRRGKASLV